MNRRFFLLLFPWLILATSHGLFAQYYLVLKKRSRVKHVFEAGESLKFRLKGERFYYEHMMVGFHPDKVRFHYFDLNINEIASLKIPKAGNYAVSLASQLTITGGVFALDQLNQGLVMNEGLGPSEETLLISGGLLGTGLLLKLFKKRKFKIDGIKYRLETTDFVSPG